MSMIHDFEKDEVQLKKAKIKIGAVKSIIPELIRLNSELTGADRKPYTILLDYISFEDHKIFLVDIRKSFKRDATPILRIHFGLKNVEDGLNLFDEVRDCFMENEGIIYSAFTKDIPNRPATSYSLVGQHSVNLEYKIHTQEEFESLNAYNERLYATSPEKVLMKIKNC